MVKRDPILFLCVLCLFLPISGAYGSSIGATWTGSGGDSSWSNAGNWNPSGAPINNGTNTFGVTIGPPGATVNLLGGITIDSLAMNSSKLGMSSGGPNSLTLAMGPSSLTNSQIVGGTFTSNGTLTLNAATFNASTLNNNGTVNTAGGLNILGGTLVNSSGASISVVNSAALQLEAGGSYTNNGTINIGSSGSAGTLLLDGTTANGASGTTVTLGGSGSLTLNGSGIEETGTGLTLANGSGHTIQGAGGIGDPGLTLNNQGTINANQATSLTVVVGSITNSGTMEATTGGLLIGSNTINNAGGTILANGATVVLAGPVGASAQVITGGAVNIINSGTLMAPDPAMSMQGVTLTVDATSTASIGGTVGGGSVVNNSGTVVLGGATFNSSTLNNSGTVNTAGGLNILGGTLVNNAGASINVTSSAALQLEAGGSYTNNGTINIGSSSSAGTLLLDGTTANGASGTTVALGGTGSLTLNGSGIEETGSGGLTLVNGAGHTIQGTGGIGDPGLTLTNQGTINANQTSGLTVMAGSITNSGTMEATAGGLVIGSNTIDNAGGTILANGGTVVLAGPVGASAQVITGGAVNAINGGTLLATGAATTMEGVTLTIDGTSTALIGGTIAGGSVVNNSGTVVLGGATFNSSTLNNNGTVNTAGGLNILGGTLVNNASINVTNSAALQLEAGGSYTNNGTINIGSSGSTGTLLLDGTVSNGASGTTVTLGGTGSLTLNSSNIGVSSAGLTLVNGTGHTIQGSGQIGGDPSFALNNQGIINANQTAGLTVAAGSITNGGTMEATAGGLIIGSDTINNAGGTILANGGTVTLAGPFSALAQVVTGGAVNVINSGTLLATGTATSMQGVTLTVDGTSTAVIGGTIGGGSVVNNSGTVVLGGATFNSSTLNNNGNVNATAGVSPFTGTLSNNAGATINVTNSAALEFLPGGKFTNNGTLNVAELSGFVIGSGANFTNYQNQTLTGGTYNIAGSLILTGADIVTNQATLAMSGGGVVEDASNLRDLSDNGTQGQFSLLNGFGLMTNGDFTNSGAVTISLGSALIVNAAHGTYTQTGGSTMIDGTLMAGTVDLNGGDISGTGELEANVENNGSVDPGDAPGTLNIDGDYTQGAGGVLNIEIDSATEYDALDIIGAAQLGGTLNVSFGGGFEPYDFETFSNVMTFSSVSGNFANVDPAGNWVEIWTGDSLSLEFVTPEPSTWVLLAAGLIGFGWFRRRARARG